MTLTPDMINKIAHLARLNYSDEATPVLNNKLSKILDFITQMNATDTTEIEPLAHPLNLSQRMREDAVTEINQREKYQKCAPTVEAGLYLVPKVIE